MPQTGKDLSFQFSYLFLARNRVQIENREKTLKNPGVFQKNFPIEIFFKNFQNYLRELSNRSFDREFLSEKRYNGKFFDKMNMWGDTMASNLILCLYDVTKSLKMRQGNRGDMWKIQVTRQFFRASDPHCHFFRESKKTFFRIWFRGMCVPNFRAVSFPFGQEVPYKQIDRSIFTSENRNILDRLLASRAF